MRWLVIAALFATTSGLASDNWPGFRGLAYLGRSLADGPTEWSAEHNVAWKTAIPGHGRSSPVVVGEKVFLTTGIQDESVAAFRSGIKLLGVALLTLAAFAGARCVLCGGVGVKRYGSSAVAAGLYIAGLCYGPELLLFDRSLARAVLGGLLLLSSALALLSALVHSRNALRVLLGLTILMAAIGAGLVGAETGSLRSAGAAGGSLAIPSALILASWRLSAESLRDSGGRRLAVTFYLLPLIAAAALPLVLETAAWTIGEKQLAPAKLPVLSWLAFLPPAVVLAAIACPGWPGGSRRGTLRAATVAACGLVIVAIAVGGAYVQPNQSYIRAVIAVDRSSGRLLWMNDDLRGPWKRTNYLTSPATPTVATDGKSLYAYFGTAGLIAVDLEGRSKWVNSDLAFEGEHGIGASPTILDGRVYVLGGGPTAPYIAAVDAASGSIAWRRALRGNELDLVGDYSSPVVVEAGGAKAVAAWGQSGLWLFKTVSGEVISSHEPSSSPHYTCASISYRGSIAFLPRNSGLDAVSLASGDALKAPLWANRRARSGCASPVLADNLLFAVSHNGIAHCIDVTNGESRWHERLPPGEYVSSVIAAGSRVYFTNTQGVTTVVAAEPRFRLIATNDVGEGVVATLAPADGSLYLRTDSHLMRIEQGEKEQADRTEESR